MDEPTGVTPAVVLTVRVDWLPVPELEIGLGLNEAEVPAGSPGIPIPKVAVQAKPLPLNVTVIAYVAELPAGTGVGLCAPTAEILLTLKASVNVV